MNEMWIYLLRVLGALAILIPLAILSTKWWAGRSLPLRGKGSMQIVESLSLGPRQGIHLLKVGGSLLVIGVTEGGMATLAELEAGEFHSVLKQELRGEGPQGRGVQTSLEETLKAAADRWRQKGERGA